MYCIQILTTAIHADAAKVPITHKFLEKRVHSLAGRVYTASTFFLGRAWFTGQARPSFQPSALGRVH